MTWRKLVFALVTLGRRPEIVKVTVRGEHFEPVKTLTSPQELAAFAELWWSKIEASRSVTWRSNRAGKHITALLNPGLPSQDGSRAPTISRMKINERASRA